MVKEVGLPINDEKTVLAYAIAKQTLVNEMEEFHKYNQTTMTEFYEFLGRLAELITHEAIPLANKIEKMFSIIFPFLKMKVINPY